MYLCFLASSWNDLTNLLGEWAQSSVDFKRETSLQIFSYLLGAKVPLEPFYESLTKFFIAGLADSSPSIRIASLEASIQFLIWCNTFREQFKKMIPNCFEVCIRKIYR